MHATADLHRAQRCVAAQQLEAALQLAAQHRQPASPAASHFESLLPPPQELSVVAEHCNDRKRSAKVIQVCI